MEKLEDAQPRPEATFRCQRCDVEWRGPPTRVADDPDRPAHPYRYFGTCASCGEEVEQMPWERNLMAAWSQATGPKTPEGKARSAANLDGHPTPEEAKLTRFNAVKHGAFLTASKYLPARPGKYARCDGCEFRDNICQTQTACLKAVEIYMQHHIAFEQGRPEILGRLNADLQGSLRALIDEILMVVMQDGVRLKNPAWYYDKDGGFHLAEVLNPDTGEMEPIYELSEHPLLKRLADMVAKNNLALADMGMTPKAQDETDLLAGYLDRNEEDRERLEEFHRRQGDQLERLEKLVVASREDRDSDPALLEYQQQEDDGG